MKKITAAITTVHAWAPEDLLTNAMLEKMVETNDEWITSRTGIKQRHILKGEGLGSSDMAVRAILPLLEKRGISPDDLDCIICATTTPDMLFPATANIIADKIGATKAFGFDVSAACSGFIFGLVTGSKFVESGTHKKVLVVGTDKMSSIIDYTDRNTCVLFGDGAGAVLLEPNEEGFGIMDADLHSDGSGRVYLHMKAGGSVRPASAETVANKEHYVFQDGAPVFKFAVRGMADAVAKVMESSHLQVDEVAWVIPHQANRRIIESVARELGFPMERVAVNIQDYGNTTNGTIPICLWEWEKQFKKGDNLILTAFGGGFTWGAIYLKWAY